MSSYTRQTYEDQETYVTASALAAYFSVSPRSINRWRKAGLIPAVAMPGGAYRYRVQEVEASLERVGVIR